MATCTSAASVWTCSHMTGVANVVELCGHLVEQGFWIRMSRVLSASPSAVLRAPRQSHMASDAPGKPCRL